MANTMITLCINGYCFAHRAIIMQKKEMELRSALLTEALCRWAVPSEALRRRGVKTKIRNFGRIVVR